MKKLLPVILLCLFLDSCEKEYCWRCEYKSKLTDKVNSVKDYCDKSEEEMEELVKQFPSSSHYYIECARYMK